MRGSFDPWNHQEQPVYDTFFEVVPDERRIADEQQQPHPSGVYAGPAAAVLAARPTGE